MLRISASSPFSVIISATFAANSTSSASLDPTIMPRPIIFRGIVAASSEEAPAHCSAPPLQANFRLPRLSRDAETVTRPRSPLLPAKWEEASESGAVVEFGVDRFDEVEVKVEAEARIEVAADPRQVCVQVSAVGVGRSKGPGRPKGSKSRPRVEPRFDTSAPPERDEAKKALAKIASKRRTSDGSTRR